MALAIAKPTAVPSPPKSPVPSLTQLHHHSTITTEFAPLLFEAAASLQLRPNITTEHSTHLIASPYNHPAHLLDISGLEKQDRLFALALSYLKPTRNDYATAPYTESFNWTEIFDLVKAFSETEKHDWTAGSYYVVIFRSILLPDIDNDRLFALDSHSHREAIASGGLLKYWYGAKNEERKNLATCIWRSRNDARLGGRGPWHAQARAAASIMYEEIKFTTYKLDIHDGVKGWELSDWKDDA